jgi:hypothetical protein
VVVVALIDFILERVYCVSKNNILIFLEISRAGKPTERSFNVLFD